MPGEFAGRRLKKIRNHFRWKKVDYIRKKKKLWMQTPLHGAPQARGIVISKRNVEQKQPSSGLIKAVRVQLIKNNIQVTAFVPGTNSISNINEHDEVLIEGVGGSQGGSIGSMSALKYKVVAVNGVNLRQIMKGKKQKPTR